MLEERWQRPVVPLFWSAGDDHDFAEARSTSWLRRDGTVGSFSLPARAPDAPQLPMYSTKVSAEVTSLLAALEEDVAAEAADARDDEGDVLLHPLAELGDALGREHGGEEGLGLLLGEALLGAEPDLPLDAHGGPLAGAQHEVGGLLLRREGAQTLATSERREGDRLEVAGEPSEPPSVVLAADDHEGAVRG